jgi:teichuronic acid biosynthesis glycosyltransferase TuaG
MATVSIIMPSFNSARYIGSAINSVLMQSFKDFKFIIYDDNSDDNTIEIIESFKDERIFLMKSDVNRGAGYARRAALKFADSNYIAFLDSDDIWYEHKLDKCISYLEENLQISGVQSNFQVSIDGIKQNIVKPKRRITLPDMMQKNHCAMSCMVIRGHAADKVEMPLLRARQDYAYWIRILQNKAIFATIDETLVEYRKVKGSISSSPMKNVWYNYKMFRYELKFPVLKAASIVAINIIEKFKK